MSILDLEKLPETISPDLDLDQVKRDCEELVKSQAKFSAGAAVLPIPLVDLVIDASLLTKLLPQITQRFGLIPESAQVDLDKQDHESWMQYKDRAVQFVSLALSRGIAKKTIQGFGGRIIAQQVTKIIPFGGQLVSATMGYLIFKKIADDHINDCYKAAKQIQQNQHAKNV